jgi:ribosomal-protein-alanine N-acetyltransferase
MFAFDRRCAAAPDSLRFLQGPPASSVDEIQAHLAGASDVFSERSSVFAWLVRWVREEPVIGYVAFVRWDHANHRSEIAYAVEPAHRQKGITVKAMRLILDFAWRELPLHRAEAHVDPENVASIKTAERLGFVHEATLRENVFANERYFDTAIYARLRDDGT